jgi:hypothetical protein
MVAWAVRASTTAFIVSFDKVGEFENCALVLLAA